MNHATRLLSCLLPLAPLCAQGGDLLFTTSQDERTLSGSAGTVLRDLRPNEIIALPGAPCFGSAEKWAPRSAFHTMAGDEDGDDIYWEPGLFANIDALLVTPALSTAGSPPNQRTTWFSPRAAMGTVVSGPVGLRPGDVGRIVRTTAGDGRVQHFVRAEQIQIALGMPPVPVVIDVDAVAWGPNQGLYLSLDQDHMVNICGGPTLLRDGDVFVIAPWDLAMTAAGTVGGVNPASAVVVYTEAQVDLMVANATVANRFGACVPAAVDLEALEIDWNNPFAMMLPTCSGLAVAVPNFLFTTETLTGGAVLNTAAGGVIHPTPCGPLGTPCGGGPTLGLQMGLLPPSAAMGVPSHVTALASTRVFHYVAEAKQPQIPVGTPAVIDLASPGLFNWVFLTLVPGGPGAVAPSVAFPWGWLGFPDYYPTPFFVGAVPTVGGFATLASPPIPIVCDLVFQAVTVTTAGSIELSTPTMVEVF